MSTHKQQELTIPELEKLLLDTLEEGNEIGSIQVWNVCCALSIALNHEGLKSLKEKDLDSSENYFLQAKKYTEPEGEINHWTNYEEWYYQRISLFINLTVLYRKQKKIDKCNEILSEVLNECEESEMYQKITSNFQSNIETLYFQYAECCLEQENFAKSAENAQKAINIIKFFERQNDIQDQKNMFKKIVMKIHSYFIIGKCLSKDSNKDEQTIQNFNEAYLLAKFHFGEQDLRTEKYKQKLDNFKIRSQKQKEQNKEQMQKTLQFQEELQNVPIELNDFRQDLYSIKEQEQLSHDFVDENPVDLNFNHNSNKKQSQNNKNKKQEPQQVYEDAENIIQELKEALDQNQNDNTKIMRKKQKLNSTGMTQTQYLSKNYSSDMSTRYSSMINIMNSRTGGSARENKDGIKNLRSHYESLFSNDLNQSLASSKKHVQSQQNLQNYNFTPYGSQNQSQQHLYKTPYNIQGSQNQSQEDMPIQYISQIQLQNLIDEKSSQISPKKRNVKRPNSSKIKQLPSSQNWEQNKNKNNQSPMSLRSLKQTQFAGLYNTHKPKSFKNNIKNNYIDNNQNDNFDINNDQEFTNLPKKQQFSKNSFKRPQSAIKQNQSISQQSLIILPNNQTNKSNQKQHNKRSSMDHQYLQNNYNSNNNSQQILPNNTQSQFQNGKQRPQSSNQRRTQSQPYFFNQKNNKNQDNISQILPSTTKNNPNSQLNTNNKNNQGNNQKINASQSNTNLKIYINKNNDNNNQHNQSMLSQQTPMIYYQSQTGKEMEKNVFIQGYKGNKGIQIPLSAKGISTDRNLFNQQSKNKKINQNHSKNKLLLNNFKVDKNQTTQQRLLQDDDLNSILNDNLSMKSATAHSKPQLFQSFNLNTRPNQQSSRQKQSIVKNKNIQHQQTIQDHNHQQQYLNSQKDEIRKKQKQKMQQSGQNLNLNNSNQNNQYHQNQKSQPSNLAHSSQYMQQSNMGFSHNNNTNNQGSFQNMQQQEQQLQFNNEGESKLTQQQTHISSPKNQNQPSGTYDPEDDLQIQIHSQPKRTKESGDQEDINRKLTGSQNTKQSLMTQKSQNSNGNDNKFQKNVSKVMQQQNLKRNNSNMNNNQQINQLNISPQQQLTQEKDKQTQGQFSKTPKRNDASQQLSDEQQQQQQPSNINQVEDTQQMSAQKIETERQNNSKLILNQMLAAFMIHSFWRKWKNRKPLKISDLYILKSTILKVNQTSFDNINNTHQSQTMNQQQISLQQSQNSFNNSNAFKNQSNRKDLQSMKLGNSSQTINIQKEQNENKLEHSQTQEEKRKSTLNSLNKFKSAFQAINTIKRFTNYSKYQQDHPDLQFYKPMNSKYWDYWKIKMGTNVTTYKGNFTVQLNIQTIYHSGSIQLRAPSTSQLEKSIKQNKSQWVLLDEALQVYFKFQGLLDQWDLFNKIKSKSGIQITKYKNGNKNQIASQEIQENFNQLIVYNKKQNKKNMNTSNSFKKNPEFINMYEVMKKISFFINKFVIFFPKINGKTLQICQDQQATSQFHKSSCFDQNQRELIELQKERRSIIYELANNVDLINFDLLEKSQDFVLQKIKMTQHMKKQYEDKRLKTTLGRTQQKKALFQKEKKFIYHKNPTQQFIKSQNSLNDNQKCQSMLEISMNLTLRSEQLLSEQLEKQSFQSNMSSSNAQQQQDFSQKSQDNYQNQYQYDNSFQQQTSINNINNSNSNAYQLKDQQQDEIAYQSKGFINNQILDVGNDQEISQNSQNITNNKMVQSSAQQKVLNQKESMGDLHENTGSIIKQKFLSQINLGTPFDSLDFNKKKEQPQIKENIQFTDNIINQKILTGQSSSKDKSISIQQIQQLEQPNDQENLLQNNQQQIQQQGTQDQEKIEQDLINIQKTAPIPHRQINKIQLEEQGFMHKHHMSDVGRGLFQQSNNSDQELHKHFSVVEQNSHFKSMNALTDRQQDSNNSQSNIKSSPRKHSSNNIYKSHQSQGFIQFQYTQQSSPSVKNQKKNIDRSNTQAFQQQPKKSIDIEQSKILESQTPKSSINLNNFNNNKIQSPRDSQENVSRNSQETPRNFNQTQTYDQKQLVDNLFQQLNKDNSDISENQEEENSNYNSQSSNSQEKSQLQSNSIQNQIIQEEQMQQLQQQQYLNQLQEEQNLMENQNQQPQFDQQKISNLNKFQMQSSDDNSNYQSQNLQFALNNSQYDQNQKSQQNSFENNQNYQSNANLSVNNYNQQQNYDNNYNNNNQNNKLFLKKNKKNKKKELYHIQYFPQCQIQPLLLVPSRYINTFFQKQLLITSLIKIRKQTYFSTVTLMFDEKAQKSFDLNHIKHFIWIEIKAMQKQKGWYSQFTMSLYNFLELFFPDNDISNSDNNNGIVQLNKFKFLQFILNSGFNSKQKIFLEQQLRKKLVVQKTELTYRNTVKQQLPQQEDIKIRTKQMQMLDHFNPLVSQFKSKICGLNDFDLTIKRDYLEDVKILKQIVNSKENQELVMILYKKYQKKQQIQFANGKEGSLEQVFQEQQTQLIQKQLKQISQRTRLKMKIFISLYLTTKRQIQQQNKILEKNKYLMSSEQIEYVNDHFSRVSERTIHRNYHDKNYFSQFQTEEDKKNKQALISKYESHPTYYNQNLGNDQQDIEKIYQEQEDDMVLLYSYNSALYLDQNTYMIHLKPNKKDFQSKTLKIEFLRNHINEQFQTYVNITIYSSLSENIEKVIIKDAPTIEKLILILQYESDELDVNTLFQTLINNSFIKKQHITGKKLQFKSYASTNEESEDIPKALKKFNQNDTMLCHFVKMFNHYQTYNYAPKSFQRYLHKIKLTLISHDINDASSQSNFISCYFYKCSVIQQCKIDNFGNVLVQSCVFKTNKLYNQYEEVFLKIDILKKNTRTSQLKMIFDIHDIKAIVSDSFNYNNCLDKHIIYQIVQKLSEKLVCYSKGNYMGLKLPMQYISKNTKKHKYDLVNSYDTTSMTSSAEISILSRKSFLTPVLKDIQIITKGILKIKNQFAIYTIRKFKQLNFFQILIYIPLSQRKWICQIYPSDLVYFTPQFMEKIFPHLLLSSEEHMTDLITIQNKGSTKKSQKITYEQYVKKYEQYKSETYQQYESENESIDIQQDKSMESQSQSYQQQQRSLDSQGQPLRSKNSLESISSSRTSQGQSYYQPSSSKRGSYNQLIMGKEKRNSQIQQEEGISEESEQHQIVITSPNNQNDVEEGFKQKIGDQQNSDIQNNNSKQNIETLNYIKSKSSLNASKTSNNSNLKQKKLSKSKLSNSQHNNSQQQISENSNNEPKNQSENEINETKNNNQSDQSNQNIDESQNNSNTQSNSSQSQSQSQNDSQSQLTDSNKIEEEESSYSVQEQESEEFDQQNFQYKQNYIKNPKQFQDLFNFGCKSETSNFFQIKLWEDMINELIIEKNINKKFILTINNFNGQLRETIYSTIMNFTGYDNAYFEMFLDNSEYPVESLFSIFPSKRLVEKTTFYDQMYLKLDFFSQFKTTNDKIKLRHLLYTHFQESRYDLQNHKNKDHNSLNMRNYEFVLGDLQQIGKTCAQKLKSYYLEKYNIKQEIPIQQTEQNQKNNYDQNINNTTTLYTTKTQNEKTITVMDYEKQGTQNVIDSSLYIKTPEMFKNKNNFGTLDNQQQQAQKRQALNTNIPQDQKLQGQSISFKEVRLMVVDENCKAEIKPNKNIDIEGLLRKQKPNYYKQIMSDPLQNEENAKLYKDQLDNNNDYNEMITNKQYLLIYRGVFTIKPMQMIAIFFKKDKHQFYTYIWNASNSKKIKKTLKMKNVIYAIPCAEHIIKMGNLQELGKRIYMAFKNTLLIQTYYKLND